MEGIRTWLLGLAGAAVFGALCGELTPEGSVRRVEKMVCGLVMTLALISPLLRLDFGRYSLNLAKYREYAESISASAEEISDSLSRTFIEERCEAYILDKAALLNADVSGAEVTLRWSGEGVWYPVEAAIHGTYCQALAEKVEEELGIRREDQHWDSDEDS